MFKVIEFTQSRLATEDRIWCMNVFEYLPVIPMPDKSVWNCGFHFIPIFHFLLCIVDPDHPQTIKRNVSKWIK